jgi:hypothetical protein
MFYFFLSLLLPSFFSFNQVCLADVHIHVQPQSRPYFGTGFEHPVFSGFMRQNRRQGGPSEAELLVRRSQNHMRRTQDNMRRMQEMSGFSGVMPNRPSEAQMLMRRTHDNMRRMQEKTMRAGAFPMMGNEMNNSDGDDDDY